MDDKHIDKLARGVMACHRKGITLEAVQEAVKTFWGVAEAMRAVIACKECNGFGYCDGGRCYSCNVATPMEGE
jgi:hypothetical protein